MKSSMRDQAAGVGKTISGKIKESTGAVLGKPGLKIKGKAEQVEGKLQRKLGEREQAAGH